MWYDLYKHRRLSVILEVSTYCNAKCPQCDRTDINGLGVSKKFRFTPDLNMSLENFKRYFTPEVLSRLMNIHFSGSFGDPLMNPHILSMVEYVIKTDDRCTVSINTNGSLRNEDFWWSLGSVGKKRLTVIFDVDGITQEMHEKYRRATSLKKVLQNMDTLSLTPAKVKTFTVLFKHNQDYKDEIEKLCREHGSTECDILQSNRFKEGPVFSFVNEKGEKETLEQVTNNKLRVEDLNRPARRVRDYRFRPQTTQIIQFIKKPESKAVPQKTVRKVPEISCYFLNNKNLHIDVNGIVYPCCHWEIHNDHIKSFNKETLYHDFHDNLDKNNLNNYSFEEILSNKYYNNGIYESFKDPDKISTPCIFMCRKI